MDPTTHPPFKVPTPEGMNLLLPAFEFIALISSSAHSAVFAAHQRSLDRHVAIKILSPHLSSDPVFRESFELTARTMAKLSHPNLIGVYDSGTVDAMLYFVMEFIPGKSLEHSSRGQCIEYAQTLGMIGGICNGLAHAHENGIFHGGIEPSVILLTQKAEPKISHFGIHYAADGKTNLCMAPEMISGAGAANQSADQYAVGAILYQLLTGQPHRQDAPAPSTLIKCDPLIDPVWRKATHIDPSRRYSSVIEFQKEIATLLKVSQQPKVISLTAASGSAKRAAPGNQPAPVVLPPASESRRSVAKPAVNYWGVILNLSLLVVLWLVYDKIWKNRNVPRQQPTQNHNSVQSKGGERSTAEAAKLAERGNSQSAPKGKIETPENSLARLRSALVAGKRDEMPIGSLRRESCDYLCIKQPMSWPEAVDFAEQHGAHLMIQLPGANLKELTANEPAVWIGAARNGLKSWALANGKPWIPQKEPSGSGDYVMISKDGSLRTEGGKTRLPFVIQWHLDGKNPGELETLLAATGASIAANSPFFPPGTRTVGSRRFMFVARSIGWESARKLAESAGGHLAVPATPEESAVMEEMASNQIAHKGIWLGGNLIESQWTWITGEPWKSVEWILGVIPNAPNSTLLMLPGKGWSAGKSSTLASGFFIEWSNDKKSNPSKAGSSPASIDLPALNQKAKDLIVAADGKRTEQLRLNSKKFIAELDLHIRALPKRDQQIFGPGAEKIKACITSVRVPSIIPRSSRIKIDQKMDELVKYHSNKQEQLDAEFLAASGKIHTAYLAKIRGAVSQAGQGTAVESLTEALDGAEDLKLWIQSLGVDAKPANPSFVPDEATFDERKFTFPE